MRRARSIIGLPIISLAEGLRVGQVRDLVLDPENHSVAALVVDEASWRREAEVVPIEMVRSFGRDAITMVDLTGLVKVGSRRELAKLLTSGVKMDGLLAMTEGGNYLGVIEEVLLGPRGQLLAYEISVGFAEDVNRGKVLLPAEEIRTVGRDVATFPDELEELVDEAAPETEAVSNDDALPVLQPARRLTA